jgi:hypothetical protein
VRGLVLLALFSVAALYEAKQVAAFASDDIWWHLRTGMWILSHHAVPVRGLFSQVADRPWVDSDWGFQAILAAAYSVFGLRSASLLLMLSKFLLALLTFVLAGGWRKNFWSVVLLSAAAQYALANLTLIPMFCSVLCFGVELILLLESRRHSDARYLFCLPPLFFLWANLHIQFVNGLLVLGLFLLVLVAEHIMQKLRLRSHPRTGLLPLAPAATTAIFSLVAALITPNSLRLFPEFSATVYGSARFKYFAEMRALHFRQPQDFVLLALAMAAFLALGLERPRDYFKCALMVVSVMLAFRVARDTWFAVFPAIACVAAVLPDATDEKRFPGLRNYEKPIVVSLGLLFVLIAFMRVPSDEVLLRRASKTLPINACDFLRNKHLPGPLFNTSGWSGFLVWYLPEYPVSIDSRLGLYGDRANAQYFALIDGTARLETNPSFAGARTFLLEADSGLAKGLTTLPTLRDQFRVVYQDSLAVVLVRSDVAE